MMVVIRIAVIVFLLYAVFIIAPALVAYEVVFSPKRKKTHERSRTANEYYYRYRERVDSSQTYLRTLPVREIKITGHGGAVLCADYYDGGNKRLAVLFHGYNASPYNQFAVQAEYLYKRGFDLLIVYQRAHEKSGGKNTTLGITEQYDVLDWINRAERINGVCEILVYGISMGASAVAYASDRLNGAVKGMVLDCGFCSVYEQIAQDCKRRHLPGRLLLFVIRLEARLRLGVDIKQTVIPSLGKTKVPALFIHGTDDITVPVSQAEENFDACGSAKKMLVVEGARHTEAFLKGGAPAPDIFIKWLETIFRKEGETNEEICYNS